MSYKFPSLDREEFATLSWLAAHGYDGGFLDLVTWSTDDDETYHVEPIPEHVAWQVRDAVDDDPDAFLACNGSHSLATKLWDFINSIV